MLLMSLRARNLVVRKEAKKTIKDLFGFYVRLTRGAFCNAGLLATPDGDLRDIPPALLAQITETFSQEFFVTLTESLLSEILYCSKEGTLQINNTAERVMTEAIYKIVSGGNTQAPTTINDLRDYCAGLHLKIGEYTKRKFIYQENPPVPVATLDLHAFKRILDVVKQTISDLRGSQITVLLDEYENLLRHQKIVVNELIKMGQPELSIKIAKKVGVAEISETLSGQELQEIHDYTRIPLVYSVDNDREFASYKDLLANITTRALASHAVSVGNLEAFLPGSDASEFHDTEISEEVKQLVGTRRWNKLSEKKQREKIAYYRQAAVYRLIYGRPGGGREKAFAGFSDLAFLSSGVIRYFQEFLGMAYYLQFESDRPASQPVVIQPDRQNRAVYLVSEHNLAALSRNVEKHGERLKYFLLDLGDCLRFKLLRHPSEPEAGRLSITDPERLDRNEFQDVTNFLTLGVREGVFQLTSGRPGMRPKHPGDPQPVEFNISRIFCPALQFSPRLRWRTPISAEDLKNLLSPDQRRLALRMLFNKLVTRQTDDRQKEIGLL